MSLFLRDKYKYQLTSQFWTECGRKKFTLFRAHCEKRGIMVQWNRALVVKLACLCLNPHLTIFFWATLISIKGYPCGSVVKNPPANAGDVRDAGLIPGSGGSLRGGNGNPLQYSCLENLMDREAWWTTAQGATQSEMTERPRTYALQ